jgi:hypothetical protein
VVLIVTNRSLKLEYNISTHILYDEQHKTQLPFPNFSHVALSLFIPRHMEMWHLSLKNMNLWSERPWDDRYSSGVKRQQQTENYTHLMINEIFKLLLLFFYQITLDVLSSCIISKSNIKIIVLHIVSVR